MKAMLIRTAKGLRGATPEDDAAYAKFKRRLVTMKEGGWLRMEWSTPRNGPHHRKMMALLNLVAENSETWDTTAKALIAVKLAAGYFDPIVDPETGEILKVPHSIAFDAMEQDDFDMFYKAVLDAVLRVILPQLDASKADTLLDMIVEGWT